MFAAAQSTLFTGRNQARALDAEQAAAAELAVLSTGIAA